MCHHGYHHLQQPKPEIRKKKNKVSQLFFTSALLHIQITTSYLLSWPKYLNTSHGLFLLMVLHSMVVMVTLTPLAYPVSVECLDVHGFSTVHIWSHTSQLFLKSEECGWCSFRQWQWQSFGTGSTPFSLLWPVSYIYMWWCVVLHSFWKICTGNKTWEFKTQTYELPGNLLFMIMCEY